MRKKTADNEVTNVGRRRPSLKEAAMNAEFKRLEKITDGINEAVQFLRDEGRHVELGIKDTDLWIKVDGVLIE